MKNKGLIIGTAVFIAIIGFLFLVYKLTLSSQTAPDAKILALRADDHLTWSPDKKNVLIEYSDFQCPACKEFHIFLKQFEASSSPDFIITKKVTFVYRHFPLYQIHPNAIAAGRAAEAAGNQGKFFAMADLLFNHQDEWSNLSDPTNFFIQLASNLKLNTSKFIGDMAAKEAESSVNNDLADGNSLGINATPTFFLNGKKMDFSTFDEFRKILLNL